MSTVTVSGLSKSYGGPPVLSHVDLVVPNGTIMGVLGSSGCGKTTMLRVVAGFLAPDAGTVAFDGRTVAGDGVNVAAQHRRVGYVPQEGALFPHLDVRANILFGLPRRERRDDRLREMLDLAELPSHIASAYPHELSGGQQQRVALARALAPDPRVVLLDEPFSSLDAALRESAGREVARVLRAAGATAIMVTHDQDEALSLADEVAVMRAGRLAQVDTPVDLYLSPVDVEVASFVGGATVLDARLRGDKARCVLGEVGLVPHDLDDGDAVVIVRPEQIDVLPGGGPGPQGVVDVVSFYGHSATLRMRAEDGSTLVARVPAFDVPRPGDQVTLAVRGLVRAFRRPR
jgi:iron(III) transport system ATP-binding protein